MSGKSVLTRLSRAENGLFYPTNYLIDLDAGIIVDVEATPALRSDEVNSTKVMIDRVEERFDMKPARMVGDTAYGVAPMLGWMVNDKQIEPHVPVWDRSERDDGSLSSSDFAFEAKQDRYRRHGCLQTIS